MRITEASREVTRILEAKIVGDLRDRKIGFREKPARLAHAAFEHPLHRRATSLLTDVGRKKRFREADGVGEIGERESLFIALVNRFKQ